MTLKCFIVGCDVTRLVAVLSNPWAALVYNCVICYFSELLIFYFYFLVSNVAHIAGGHEELLIIVKIRFYGNKLYLPIKYRSYKFYLKLKHDSAYTLLARRFSS